MSGPHDHLPRCWLVGTEGDRGQSQIIEGRLASSSAADGTISVWIGSGCGVLHTVPSDKVYALLEDAEQRLREVQLADIEQPNVDPDPPLVAIDPNDSSVLHVTLPAALSSQIILDVVEHAAADLGVSAAAVIEALRAIDGPTMKRGAERRVLIEAAAQVAKHTTFSLADVTASMLEVAKWQRDRDMLEALRTIVVTWQSKNANGLWSPDREAMQAVAEVLRG